MTCLKYTQTTKKHKLLEECKTNLSFLTQQENILLNIDEQEEEGNEYLTFSEGKTNNGSGDNGDKEQEDDGVGAGGGDDDNIDDMIDIDEI